MSAMDLDFIDPEVEPHMDERQMEEEEEIAIHGARGGDGDNEDIYRLERI